MTHKNRPRFSIQLRSFYQWHRYTGLVIATLVFVLAITGIALNHTEEFQLDERNVKQDWLLDWYGIRIAASVLSYASGKHWVSQIDQQIYLDHQPLFETDDPLLGALQKDQMWILATSSKIYLYSLNGELIDTLTQIHGVPPDLQAIGQTQGQQLALRAANNTYQVDQDFLHFTEQPLQQVHWTQAEVPPSTLQDTLQSLSRQQQLSWEKVILDLHSGRILGNVGVWMMDAAAIGLVFLAGSGSWIWLQNRRKRAKHGNKAKAAS